MREPEALLLLNIDADPDPRDAPRDDARVLRQYGVMADIVRDRCAGKAAIGVHTSPMFRTRFLGAPFLEIWDVWQKAGADLVLHTEEDFYQLPELRAQAPSGYLDAPAVVRVIHGSLAALRHHGLTVAAYRGGSHSQSPEIARALPEAGIRFDLSCAPGIEDRAHAIDWFEAPWTAYRVSRRNLCAAAENATDAFGLTAVPVGFDGEVDAVRGTARVATHHLANDTSDLPSMLAVWAAIRKRAQAEGRTQHVSMLVHTFSALDDTRRGQLEQFLAHAFRHGGAPASLAEIERALSVG